MLRNLAKKSFMLLGVFSIILGGNFLIQPNTAIAGDFSKTCRNFRVQKDPQNPNDARWWLVARCWNDLNKKSAPGAPVGIPISDFVGVEYNQNRAPRLKWDREDNQFQKDCVSREGEADKFVDQRPTLRVDNPNAGINEDPGNVYLVAHCYTRADSYRPRASDREISPRPRRLELNLNEHISNDNGQLKVDTDW